MYIHYIILTAQLHIGTERSIVALYHILQGKVSIQTKQDSRLFALERFYGIYTSLTRERFMDYVHRLEEKGYIQKLNNDVYVVSEIGEQWVREHRELQHHLYLDSHKYGRLDQVFFARLLLVIQVWTNAKKGKFNFIPIIENKQIEDWVKHVYQKTRHQLVVCLHSLYEELVSLLKHLPDPYPTIFINQFTTNAMVGKTMQQLALDYRVSTEEIYLITMNIIHFLLQEIHTNKKSYPLLAEIGEQAGLSKPLTQSARQTQHLLNQGYSISTIADRRRLKVNTIYDHIIEIAMFDQNFPMHYYVSSSTEAEIFQAVRKLETFKLKTIKQHVDEKITYFQIRLILIKFQQLQSKEPYQEVRGGT